MRTLSDGDSRENRSKTQNRLAKTARHRRAPMKKLLVPLTRGEKREKKLIKVELRYIMMKKKNKKIITLLAFIIFHAPKIVLAARTALRPRLRGHPCHFCLAPDLSLLVLDIDFRLILMTVLIIHTCSINQILINDQIFLITSTHFSASKQHLYCK